MRAMGTADLRLRAVGGLRKLASQLDTDHPMLGTSAHLRDAARAVERGNHIGAGRHLEAAMHTLTPLSLYRHGINDDEAIAVGKRNMDAINRHSLLVKDLNDADEHNRALAEHRDGQRAIEEGQRTERAHAKAATAQALAAAAGVSKEALAASGTPQWVIDLVGPKGYEHGWIYKGPPGGKGYVSKLTYPGQPGGAGHLQAIEAVGRKYNPTGELLPSPKAGPMNQIISTALHHTAVSVAARDMKGAHLHLEQARRAAHRLGPEQEGDVLSVRNSLADVPSGATQLYVPRPRGRRAQQMESRLGDAYQVGDAKVPDFSGTGVRSLSNEVDLSERTGMLARTPAPLGKPGGPGLYHVKGMGHSPYFQQVVKALIEKRGMPKNKAYKIAWAALRRWRRGGGHVHPEVQAAATGSLASEAAKGARAHSHTGDPLAAIDLAVARACNVIELVGPKGYTHNWVFHGRPGLSPEDRADELSHHIAHNTLPGNVPGHAAHREAARLHNHAASLSSSPAAVAHHQRMAGHHARMARKFAARPVGLSNTVDLAFDPSAHPRAAAGSAAGGQFTAGGAAPAAAKAPGKGNRAQHKAALLSQAAGLDKQVSTLSRRLRVLMLATRLQSRQSQGSKSRHPAVHGKAGGSNNPAPRKKGAPAKKGPPAARRGASGPPGGGVSTHLGVAGQIVALRSRITALRAQAAHLRAQAAKL